MFFTGSPNLSFATFSRIVSHESFINRGIDNCPRTGRAFLAIETEGGGDDCPRQQRRNHYPRDDDGVLASHFEDGALYENLSWLRLRGTLVDLQSNASSTQ